MSSLLLPHTSSVDVCSKLWFLPFAASQNLGDLYALHLLLLKYICSLVASWFSLIIYLLGPRLLGFVALVPANDAEPLEQSAVSRANRLHDFGRYKERCSTLTQSRAFTKLRLVAYIANIEVFIWGHSAHFR